MLGIKWLRVRILNCCGGVMSVVLNDNRVGLWCENVYYHYPNNVMIIFGCLNMFFNINKPYII